MKKLLMMLAIAGFVTSGLNSFAQNDPAQKKNQTEKSEAKNKEKKDKQNEKGSYGTSNKKKTDHGMVNKDKEKNKQY